MLQLRIPSEMMAAIDRAATNHGMHRPEYVRSLLAAALDLSEQPHASNGVGRPRVRAPTGEPASGSADLPETLLILSNRARAGHVAAALGLLRHHQRGSAGAVPSDPLAEVDELAARRLAEPGRNGDGDGAA
jgi:hypothetical protein